MTLKTLHLTFRLHRKTKGLFTHAFQAETDIPSLYIGVMCESRGGVGG